MEPEQIAGMTESTEHGLRVRLRELAQQNEALRRDLAEVQRLACDDCKLQQLLLEEYALQHAHEAVYLIDANHRLVYVNEEASRALGYSRDELTGMTVQDIDAHYSTAELVAVQDQGRAEGTIRHETRHRRRDGSTFPVEIQSSSFEYQGQSMGIALARDISERKAAEEALRVSEERLRLFFERQLVGMAITSPEKGWLRVNQKICDMLGYTAEELSKLSWADVTHPDDLGPDVVQFQRMLKGEIDSYTVEKRYVRKDGGTVHTALSIGCVRKADGVVDYVLALIEDITERKRYEAELMDAKKALRERNAELQVYKEQLERRVAAQTAELLAEIDARERAQSELEASRVQLRREIARRDAMREEERKRIAREVHDELGQILTGLKLHVSNLDRICALEANPLCGHVREIAELTDQAMGVARNIAVVLRPVEAEMGIVPALELQANRFSTVTDIRCECSFPDDALMLNERCTTALYRIVQELLTNVARHANADEVKIAMRREGDHYVAQVRDNGTGFDPGAINQDSFGLAGIRERVSTLGGTMDIDSHPGRGTEVTVRIPAEVCHD